MGQPSVLQLLVDERLGKSGPWHVPVGRWRGQGMSWQVCAEWLRAEVRLSAGHGLTGETLRRWSAQRANASVRAGTPAPWQAMIPSPHPRSNCGPLQFDLPPDMPCPTCGLIPEE